MTGFGEARRQRDALAVSVEVRTVNNRYFKISLRSPDGYSSLEPRLEALVRDRLRRGTVLVNLRIERSRSADDYRINPAVLSGYRRQLEALGDGSAAISLESLLALPGVVEEQASSADRADDDWPLIEETLRAAIDRVDQMRAEEGRAMARDLLANAAEIAAGLEAIARRAPAVVEGYRGRLEERVRKTLAEFQLTLDPADLIREVSLFGERCDISEELVRLRSHLDQFRGFVEGPESSGRKLEFLAQEMFREANTVGSKANDVEIARATIDIKAAIERIREMIQNVE